MSNILQGEFFWGIVVGLLLSLLGSWALAKFTVSMQQASARRTMSLFCIDALKNIQSIIAELDAARDRMRAIHHDFLMLIEVEIQIYGRNREHLINLPDDARNKIRKLMSEISIKRAEVANNLEEFYKLSRLADQIYAEGRGPEAQRIRENGSISLQNAQTAADRLVSISGGIPSIIEGLSKIR